jgi:ribonuclease Z
VTDCAFHGANRAKILALAEGADQLFIEAVFLDRDAGIAAGTRHLTAHQTGLLAREAGAKHMVPFHHSARYLDDPEALRREAMAAFIGNSAEPVSGAMPP